MSAFTDANEGLLPVQPSSIEEPLKLAVLDDYLEIAKPHFSRLGSIKPGLTISFYPATLDTSVAKEHDLLVDRLRPYHIISTMRERTRFPASILSQLPNLKLLLTTGNRNAAIDTDHLRERGDIQYVGTGYTNDIVPAMINMTNEQTWALILGITKGLEVDDYIIKSGNRGGWQTQTATAIAGKTLGVVGLGRLGAQCAITGRLGFGMNVICWSSNLTQEKADEVAARAGLEKGVFKVTGSKKELFETADVVSLHYVLSERSKGMVGQEELNAMKKDAFLINTSRGALIDETTLLEVCKAGRIKGVALDVFETEPLPKDSPWRSLDWGTNGTSRVLLTPHMGYVEKDVMHSWYEQQAKNIERWLKGEELEHKMIE